ncbi:MAG: helix-turn-helix domain-containing protein [Defluviitaleaceae bacterium]|nr:helix-turn-helix domain-containing protein [Defluviitaleaceae bacterium]
MEIHNRIKELRIILGITQLKFAKRIAVVPSFISEIENGVREINERAIRLTIAEFNVNEEWLRYGKGAIFNRGMSAFESEAMGKFKALDRIFQEDALKMLDILIEMNDKAKKLK